MSKPRQPLSALCQAVNHRYFVPICLISAFIVRMLWIYFVNSEPVSDSAFYYESAASISAGKGYTLNGIPTAYWPIGYPVFLALIFTLFGPSLFVAKISNVVLYVGILLLTYFLAKRLFHSELTGRIALLSMSFYPNHIAYTSLTLSEIWFLFLLLGGTALLLISKDSLWWAIAPGVVFGLATLTRPQVLLIPALAFATTSLKKIEKKMRHRSLFFLVILYLSLLITLSPWIARNYRVFNRFVFVSNNGGVNLFIGNNPYANGAYRWDARVTSLLGESIDDEYMRNKKAQSLALQFVAKNPLDTARLLPKKFLNLYAWDVEAINWNIAGIGNLQTHLKWAGIKRLEGSLEWGLWLFRAFAQLYYMIFVALFLFSMVVLPRSIRAAKTEVFPTIGLWISLYFTAIGLVFFGNSRFHFPIIPWLAMYVAALAGVFIMKRSSGLKAEGSREALGSGL